MSGPRWVADPSIGWRILLTARVAAPPHPSALSDLYLEHGWSPTPASVHADRTDELQRRLTRPDPHPLLVGIADRDVVVSAHHSAVDGLGLLTVLGRLGHGPVESSARGIGDRPAATDLKTGIAARLAEALLRPPARPGPVARPAAATDAADVLVERELAGRRRTSDLVHAAAHAVAQWQAAARKPDRRVAIAIGASRTRRPAGARLADDSALLRLRDVERLDRPQVEAAIRAARPQAAPHEASGALAAAVALGVRILAPRLGSSVLVSHLGEVTAPAVDRLSFHPVTAGGSGISLGAVGHAGRTVLTLRARGSRWDDDGLKQLLEAIIQRL